MRDPYYTNRLRHSKTIRKEQRRIRPLSQEIQSASRLLIGTILGMLLATTVGFFYINNVKASKGYQLKQLQLDYDELLQENRKLQGQLNQAQSIQQLEQNETIESMTEPTEDDFSYVGPKEDLAKNANAFQ